MRMGFLGDASAHSVDPTRVAIPSRPSTHAIGVGHAPEPVVPPTTTRAAARQRPGVLDRLEPGTFPDITCLAAAARQRLGRRGCEAVGLGASLSEHLLDLRVGVPLQSLEKMLEPHRALRR